MPTLATLAPAELQQRLARGLSLQTGPFRFLVQSNQPRVARDLAAVYADFALDPGEETHDFHIRLAGTEAWRRWLGRPQVNFWLDGYAPFKPLPADHGFALLEWGMNWCLAGQAHHYLMLHAAVLERQGRCIILPGEPGAGKSTLTAALMLTGWRLLSDELTMVDRDDGLIVALARPVSLKNQSIDLIRRFAPDAQFGETAHDTHKGTVAHLRPSAQSVARVQEKGRAAHIVFPRWRAEGDTRLSARPKGGSFEHVANHAFNYSLLGRLGFEMNADLIDRCDCWDFEYTRLDEALRVFEELVR